MPHQARHDGIYVSCIKLNKYESRLKEFGFFRCNNSCLLNLKYVRGISSKYVELEGEKIKISPAVYDELVAKLSQYTIG